jgi:lipoprotein NlpD
MRAPVRVRISGSSGGVLLAAALSAVVLAGCAGTHPAPIVHRSPEKAPAPVVQTAPAPVAVVPPAPEPGPIVEPVQSMAVRPSAIEARPLPGSTAGPAMPIAPTSPERASAVRTEPNALKQPYSDERLAMLRKSAPPAPAAVPPAPAAGAPAPLPVPGQPSVSSSAPPSASGFIWPASGPVIQGFAEPRSMGVSIGGKPGDPVVAAAAGRVIFSGSGPRGYGNLLIVKHDNEILSVYAHNRALLVKEGANVKRGQRIAELGDSDADRPKLHFEIRKQGTPVDPSQYLPAR